VVFPLWPLCFFVSFLYVLVYGIPPPGLSALEKPAASFFFFSSSGSRIDLEHRYASTLFSAVTDLPSSLVTFLLTRAYNYRKDPFLSQEHLPPLFRRDTALFSATLFPLSLFPPYSELVAGMGFIAAFGLQSGLSPFPGR